MSTSCERGRLSAGGCAGLFALEEICCDENGREMKRLEEKMRKKLSMILLIFLCSLLLCCPAYSAKLSFKKNDYNTQKGNVLVVKLRVAAPKVKWSVSNKAIISIIYRDDKQIYVRARKAGTAKIIAKSGKKKVSCRVTVKNVKGLPKSLTVLLGDTVTLKGIKRGDWSSSDDSIVAVQQKRKKSIRIVFKKKGLVTVTQKVGKKTYKCKVKVITKPINKTIIQPDDPTSSVTGNIQAISAGGHFTAILKKDGSLWMCGKNDFGQLGNGRTENCYAPSKVMDNVQAVSAGGDHTAILKKDGSLWMCGKNDYGQLGTGSTWNCPVPVQVMDGVQAVSAGSFHTAILKKDGSLWMCGDNSFGQFGDGNNRTKQLSPVKVMDGGVKAINAIHIYTAIIKTDGSLWTCGHNENGRLGDGTSQHRYTFVKIMDDVKAVDGALEHTAILKNDGSLWMCGHSISGELGDGTTDSTHLTPVKVMEDVHAVSVGGFYTAIIKNDGSLWMCGNNDNGQLGDGTTVERITPVKVIENVQAVAAGCYNLSHTVILKKDGSLWTCGYNEYGQLGDASRKDRYTPVNITGF